LSSSEALFSLSLNEEAVKQRSRFWFFKAWLACSAAQSEHQTASQNWETSLLKGQEEGEWQLTAQPQLQIYATSNTMRRQWDS
jgi:hypothetical protein